MERYDIFISYRRDGGQTTALLLYETLVRAGYRVAYDIETLLAGEFAPKIMDTISRCKDVLVVLSPNALVRCSDPNDLVRREIAQALASGCRVIPILLSGFAFPPPAEMPPDIRRLADQNGVAASMPHFNSTMGQIVKRLASRPRWYRRGGVLAAIAAGVLAAAAALALLPRHSARTYPSSPAECQDANRVLAGLARQSAAYNEAQGCIDDLLDAARRSLGGDRTAFDTRSPFFVNSLREPIRELKQSAPAESFLESLRGSPVPLEIYGALAPRCVDFLTQAQTRLPDELDRLLASPLSRSRKEEWHALKAESYAIAASEYALEVMELLSGFSAESTREFRQTSALWPSLARFHRGEWLRDPERIGIELRALAERRQIIDTRLASLAGNLNLEAAAWSRAGEDAMVRDGIPPEDAARISAKRERLDAMEAALADTVLAIGTARERLWLSKGATDEDDDGILWSKAGLFLARGKPADALEALDILARRPDVEFAAPAVQSFAALCRLAPDLPFTNGCMAVGFEPPATSHAVFRLGDVAVARNGAPVHRFEDLLPTDPGTAYSVQRPSPDGTFAALDVVVPPGQPRVAWVPVFSFQAGDPSGTGK